MRFLFSGKELEGVPILGASEEHRDGYLEVGLSCSWVDAGDELDVVEGDGGFGATFPRPRWHQCDGDEMGGPWGELTLKSFDQGTLCVDADEVFEGDEDVRPRCGRGEPSCVIDREGKVLMFEEIGV